MHDNRNYSMTHHGRRFSMTVAFTFGVSTLAWIAGCKSEESSPDAGTAMHVRQWSPLPVRATLPPQASPKLLPKVCNSDADCDDGLFCNGMERCRSSADDDAGGSGTCAAAERTPCARPDQ